MNSTIQSGFVKLAVRTMDAAGCRCAAHVVCHKCNRQIFITASVNTCEGCGLQVTGRGYILETNRPSDAPIMEGPYRTKKRTAANSNFLRQTKKIFNHKIYAEALRLINSEGETAARAYVQRFITVPLGY